MTLTHRGFRTLTISAALVFCAASAGAQTMHPQAQKYVGPVHAAPQVDVTARVDLLDERIAMRTADMRMFVGELKIQAMADLIEALIERQTLTDQQMRRMHRQMLDRMMRPRAEPGPSEPPEEESPEAMCSPWI
jgi:hypothetical protein